MHRMKNRTLFLKTLMSKVNFIKRNVDIIKTLLKYIPVAELFKSEIVVINQYFCQVNCHLNSKYLYNWKKNLVPFLKISQQIKSILTFTNIILTSYRNQQLTTISSLRAISLVTVLVCKYEVKS